MIDEDELIKDVGLKKNLDNLVTKVKRGFPVRIIVWGPTRAGKTTITNQMAYYMACKLKKSYTVNNIFFDAENLLNELIKGETNYISNLDEAAFDLMGMDFKFNAEKQISFIKAIMTAAVFAQVSFIVLPKLSKIKNEIVDDEHTVGIRVYYTDKTYIKGYFCGYNHTKLKDIYNLYRVNKYKEAEKIKSDFYGRFSADNSFIDLEAYKEKKIEAIRTIGTEITKKKNAYKTYLCELCARLKDDGYTITKMSAYCGMDMKNLGNDIKKHLLARSGKETK